MLFPKTAARAFSCAFSSDYILNNRRFLQLSQRRLDLLRELLHNPADKQVPILHGNRLTRIIVVGRVQLRSVSA